MTNTDTKLAQILEAMRRAPIVRDTTDQGLRDALAGVAPALRLVRKDEREGK